MPEHNGSDDFRHRANEVREIAQTLFDTAERAKVLLFVDDYETRFAIRERNMATGYGAHVDSRAVRHANGGGE